MKLPDFVTIRDVTLRDGLQNEKAFMDTDEKLRKLHMLIEAGFKRIEVTSFVHPKWIPALKDADEFAKRLPFQEGIEFEALIPNQRGLERFLNTKIQTAIFFLSASEKHNKANLNKSIEQSLTEIGKLVKQNKRAGRKSIGAISTAFVCPFQGEVPYETVEAIAERLIDYGVDELGLGDTIGKATPKQIYDYCHQFSEKFPHIPINLHLHDTYGYGLANVLAALQAGVTIFDVAQAGLGGCPYAPGSPGNIKGKKVAEFMEKQKIKTNLNLHALDTLEESFQQFLSKANLSS